VTCRWFVGAGLLAGLLVVTGPAAAGEAEIVAVEAAPEVAGTWRFSVTVRHADAGWDHYADAWQVLDPVGALLGERELLHPHDDEQPFTRSLGGVAIPENVTTVEIRARDSVHGWGPKVSYTLPDR
jgi:hypothetical protein